MSIISEHTLFFNIRNHSEIMHGHQSDKDRIPISVGTITNIIIKREYMNRLSPPYTNCRKEIGLNLNGTEKAKYGVNKYIYTQKDW